MNSLETTKPRRYYGDDCRVDPTLDLTDLKRLLHAAYTHWVVRDWHLRDFECAVEHCATMAYAAYSMDTRNGRNIAAEPLPSLPVIALATLPKKLTVGSAHRLYDELNALSPEIDLSMLDRVLGTVMAHWVAGGWHPRDFIQAAKDCAAALVYDHQICSAMGGLGGGRTATQFLSEPYHG